MECGVEEVEASFDFGGDFRSQRGELSPWDRGKSGG